MRQRSGRLHNRSGSRTRPTSCGKAYFRGYCSRPGRFRTEFLASRRSADRPDSPALLRSQADLVRLNAGCSGHGVSRFLFRLIELVLFEQPVQGAAADAEGAGGVGLVALLLAQHRQHVPPLGVVQVVPGLVLDGGRRRRQ